ncbi:POU class 2 homeobox associating-factor 2-like [Nerophis ophidion]|uniref:POU class 2 homeobox associating-factor 2-like n=1 Tax=Nerophis ophidion TaxID=159077 RepID=UPI002ADF9B71|nr:POU class 2 homeobox associating-factor 2-like [Nerophis ophidion]
MCVCARVCVGLINTNMDSEYSKRVYQGVRVKHTVKDLLAEKRSRQTNGPRYSGDSSSPPSLVHLSGSHILPNYYGMRRPLMSDADLSPSAKQFCEPASLGGYQSWSLMDSYYPDTFNDQRTFATSGGSFLPPLAGESSHFYLRDSWEQSDPEALPPAEAVCPDNISVPEVQSSPVVPGSYMLHPLEDNHYHHLTYMADSLGSKMATEEANTSWDKQDENSWPSYQLRRTY